MWTLITIILVILVVIIIIGFIILLITGSSSENYKSYPKAKAASAASVPIITTSVEQSTVITPAASVDLSTDPSVPIDPHVVVAPKTAQHPNYGKGSPLGYVVDGVQGRALALKYNQVYQFEFLNADHPLYFTTSDKGGSGAPGRIPGSITPFTIPTLVTFHPAIYPQNFYYQCALHEYMGYTVNLSY